MSKSAKYWACLLVLGVVLGLFTWVFYSSCGALTEKQAVERIWRRHMDVLGSPYVDGKLTSEFEESIEELEELTGIQTSTGTFFGRVPTGRLQEEVEQFEEWFQENKANLTVGQGCKLEIPSQKR